MSVFPINFTRSLRQYSQQYANLTSSYSVFRDFSCSTRRDKTLQAVQENKSRIKCTLIPGDGVGPELTAVVQKVFQAAKVPVEFETLIFSEVNPEKSASLEDVIKSIKKNKCCLQGVLNFPEKPQADDPHTARMKLRRGLDLFANVVPVKNLPNVKTRHKNVNIVVIREQTEGEYSALEHEAVPGVVECLKIITAVKSYRIAKFAFDYAIKFGRKKVTAVHKANIMKLADGLFLKSCKEVSEYYPRIKFDSMIVDNCAMQMVKSPDQFDVLVMPNLYGNIINNIACGLTGGAGVVAGSSYSAKYALFEQGARHAYATAVGKNIANPTAMLMAAANMLTHVNLPRHANMIKKGISSAFKEGLKTKDLGGKCSTDEFTKAVISNLNK